MVWLCTGLQVLGGPWKGYVRLCRRHKTDAEPNGVGVKCPLRLRGIGSAVEGGRSWGWKALTKAGLSPAQTAWAHAYCGFHRKSRRGVCKESQG